MWYQKSGADAPAVHDVVEHLGFFAVGNDHLTAGRRCDLRGVQLRDHAAGAERGALAPGQREDVRRQCPAPSSMSCASGFWCGSAVIQAVDVREQDQTDPHRWLAATMAERRVVVADGDVHVESRRRCRFR